MTLILAIEPDPRQAAGVAALAPAHVDAEIVIVGSVDAALEALEVRKPDLVLTPLLLSPKDDAALTAGLRRLDSEEGTLQTLVIPVLALDEPVPAPAEKPAGLLNRLRKPRTAASRTDGCSLAVFAAQVTEYLARAAAERREREDARRALEWAARPPAASAPMLGEWFTAPRASGPAAPADVPEVALETRGAASTLPEPVLETVDAEGEPEDAAVEATWQDLESFLEDLQLEAAPRAAVEGLPPDEAVEPNVIELPSPDELWAPLEAGHHQLIAPIEGPTMKERKPAVAARTPKASRAKVVKAQREAPRRPRRVQPQAKPMQDEWGLYDPEQCGFAALLERLQEMTDDEVKEKERAGRSAIMRR